MKEQFKNITYVCHSLFTAIVFTFWEIAALVSTTLVSYTCLHRNHYATYLLAHSHALSTMSALFKSKKFFELLH